jgi:hypothetical protein
MNNSSKQQWNIPVFVYFLAAALCLGGAGSSCEYLSKDLPASNVSTSGVGASMGFILFAVFLVAKGIIRWNEEIEENSR